MKGRQNALGFKHSEETLIKLRENQLNKKHNEESKLKMRGGVIRKLNKTPGSRGQIRKSPSFDNRGKSIIVTNVEDNTITEYNSLASAAKALKSTTGTIRKYIANKSIFKSKTRENNEIIIKNYVFSYKDAA